MFLQVIRLEARPGIPSHKIGKSILSLSRPLINQLPPLNRDYKRDTNIQALKRRGLINHGSTLNPQTLNPK